MRSFIVIFCLIPHLTLAQVQVQVIDPEVDTQELEKKGYKISREETEFSSLPDKEQREKLLKDFSQAKDWDELQKDIFFMDLKSKSIQELSKKYPKIPKEKLKKLKVKRG